jgi:hypothetical protein
LGEVVDTREPAKCARHRIRLNRASRNWNYSFLITHAGGAVDMFRQLVGFGCNPNRHDASTSRIRLAAVRQWISRKESTNIRSIY